MLRIKALGLLIACVFTVFSPIASRASDRGDVLSLDEINNALGSFGGDAAVEFANVMEKILANHGRPTAIIVGDEMQGSLFVGYRKGEGRLMFHGQTLPLASYMRWNAPSIGINVGASVSKVAILVYGARSAADLRQSFASIQGSYHFIGGAGISYLTNELSRKRLRDVKLIHVSVGLGLDAGVAIEKLKFK